MHQREKWLYFTQWYSEVSNEGEEEVCGDVAQLVNTSDCHAIDAGLIPRCGKGFFSQSQLSVQTLLRLSLHPHVQTHAFTSVCTLMIL